MIFASYQPAIKSSGLTAGAASTVSEHDSIRRRDDRARRCDLNSVKGLVLEGSEAPESFSVTFARAVGCELAPYR